MAKKPDSFFKQAGALPYRWDGERVEIVLITSRSSGNWIFPKGVIDPGETPESTAVKETVEEAGVIGELTGDALGAYEQKKWGGVAKVKVFPLLVTELLDDWDECEIRERQLLPIKEAKELIHDRLTEILAAFEEQVLSGAIQPAG
ncbi:NUDIX domain protein [Posidoniimonas polymericola]|uniref:NUDIX domain protein n=1 Tax=Posidoniimonas polymericola TaxID=2528002 RepID=A0A5C5XPR8_9BACT|nr:NUDIX hydrolase [Posidoniimonas polymericola]TWT65167.1 NUDIX domain protein [Posidoniimonas polymericola]